MFLLGLIGVALVTQLASTQSKPVVDDLMQRIAKGDAAAVWQLAAKQGTKAVPPLKSLCPAYELPNAHCSYGTVAGNAQVALAKLGEEGAFRAIEEELENSDNAKQYDALNKLMFLGNRRAVDVMIRAMIRFKDDPSRFKQGGDATHDRLRPIDLALSSLVPNPPVPSRSQTTDERIRKWIDWWDVHKDDQPSPLEYYFPEVSNPRITLLFREIDWQVADAVFELPEQIGSAPLAPLLRELSRGPDRTANFFFGVGRRFGSVAGNAQALGAKRGDRELFHAIVSALHQGQNALDAVEKLRFIGGHESVVALIDSLDEEKFPKWDRKQSPDAFERDVTIVTLMSLAQMVPGPPVTPTRQPMKSDIRLWREWLRSHQ